MGGGPARPSSHWDPRFRRKALHEEHEAGKRRISAIAGERASIDLDLPRLTRRAQALRTLLPMAELLDVGDLPAQLTALDHQIVVRLVGFRADGDGNRAGVDDQRSSVPERPEAGASRAREVRYRPPLSQRPCDLRSMLRAKGLGRLIPRRHPGV